MYEVRGYNSIVKDRTGLLLLLLLLLHPRQKHGLSSSIFARQPSPTNSEFAVFHSV